MRISIPEPYCPNLFALIRGSYRSFRKEMMKAQAESKESKLLRECFKSGICPRNASFTKAGDSILHKDNI